VAERVDQEPDLRNFFAVEEKTHGP
jgi:hypothetical protein